MKKQILQNAKAIILGFVLVFGSSYVFAGTFTSPTCPPPNCNADAPINVGSSSQTKTGFLQIDGVKTNTSDPQYGYGFVVPRGITWLDSLVVPKTVLTPSMQITSNGFNNNAIVFTPRNEVTTDTTSSRMTLYSPLKGMLGFWDNNLNKNVFMVNNGNTEVYGNIKITGGNPAAGYVLTAKDSSGNAEWKSSTGSGSLDLSGIKVYNTKLNQMKSKWITASICLSLCQDTGAPIADILALVGGSMLSDNQVTMDKLCSVMFPDAKYALNYQHKTWYSSSNNGTLYWDDTKSKFIEKASSGVDQFGNNLNTGVDGNAQFTCSSIPTVFVK